MIYIAIADQVHVLHYILSGRVDQLDYWSQIAQWVEHQGACVQICHFILTFCYISLFGAVRDQRHK